MRGEKKASPKSVVVVSVTTTPTEPHVCPARADTSSIVVAGEVDGIRGESEDSDNSTLRA
jgi:hypothetical protein